MLFFVLERLKNKNKLFILRYESLQYCEQISSIYFEEKKEDSVLYI